MREQSTKRCPGLLSDSDLGNRKAEAIWQGNERGRKLNSGCAGIGDSVAIGYVCLQMVDESWCWKHGLGSEC